MMESLPKSWINITLQDICYSKDGLRRGPFGSAIKKEFFVPDGYKVYEQSNAIYDDVYRGKYFISESKYNELKAFAVQEGDFLVSCSGTLGKITLVPKGAKAGIINQALLRIRTDSTLVNKSFFQYFFRSEVFQRLIFDQSQGTAMNNLIGIKDFKLLEIPFPPIAEQKRIVVKIVELFSELDKGIETLKTAQQQLKVYRQAVLKYAFEGRLTNPSVKEGELPEGWDIKKISNIGKVINGDRSSNYPSRSHYVSSGIPFISAGNIENNKITSSQLNFITLQKFESLRSGKTEMGDIVYCLRGSLGKTAIINLPQSGISSSLCILRLKEGYNAKYVHYYLSSKLASEEIMKYDNGTAQPNLSSKSFEEFKIPMCNLSQQLELIDMIESRLSVCDKIEESIEQGLQQAEALRQSILKKAFEGKLVPQDPNDEPASVLLERIKAELQKAQPDKKIKTKKVKA